MSTRRAARRLSRSWRAAWDAARAANRVEGGQLLRAVVEAGRAAAPGGASAVAGALAGAVRDGVAYRFDGFRHVILGGRALARRGWGACADGSALAAAALDGLPFSYPVQLCYETVAGADSYAHVRVLLDGHPIEPWPEQRHEVDGCTVTYSLAGPLVVV